MNRLLWTRKRAIITLAICTILAVSSLTILQMNQTTEAALIDPHPGLVGWWRFDEGAGTVASDSSDDGNDGRLKSSAGPFVCRVCIGFGRPQGVADECEMPCFCITEKMPEKIRFGAGYPLYIIGEVLRYEGLLIDESTFFLCEHASLNFGFGRFFGPRPFSGDQRLLPYGRPIRDRPWCPRSSGRPD